MNAVELYKKLPRKNCGRCRQKTCMPFAFSLLSGESELSECPDLTERDIAELGGNIKKSDWREDLISRLMMEVRTISFAEIAADLGAVIKEDGIVVRSLGREFYITTDGEVTTPGHITPWIKILLLHYLRTRGNASLTGKWVSYGDLKSGMVKALSFRRECEAPLMELFERDRSAVSGILFRLGAKIIKESAAPHVWHIFLLPKVPIQILYWPRDDEFEAKVSILFDSTADQFLDVESLMFLGEGLIKNIEAYLHHCVKTQ